MLEDGAPGHKKHVRICRELNEVDIIQWQAQSPDLVNLIEALWMDIETELGETLGRIGDILPLQQHVRIIWEQITV